MSTRLHEHSATNADHGQPERGRRMLPPLQVASLVEGIALGVIVGAGSSDTVELSVAPDTGHTCALRTHPQLWETRVIGFLDSALR